MKTVAPFWVRVRRNRRAVYRRFANIQVARQGTLHTFVTVSHAHSTETVETRANFGKPRRRGYPPAALRKLCALIGVTKAGALMVRARIFGKKKHFTHLLAATLSTNSVCRSSRVTTQRPSGDATIYKAATIRIAKTHILHSTESRSMKDKGRVFGRVLGGFPDQGGIFFSGTLMPWQ